MRAPQSSSEGSASRGAAAPVGIVAALVTALVGLVAGAIALWAGLDETDFGSSGREAMLLGLFTVAGGLGGVLRSFGYLLAYGSFSPRERGQWRREALIGPLLGAVAGFAAFLIVDAFLVGEGDPNRAGQFLVSLVCGAFALTQAGRLVERGVLRGTLSRSGILGGESSPTVPVLQRLEQMLEQRVADLTIVNFDGHVIARTQQLDVRRWMLAVAFHGGDAARDGEGDGAEAVGRLSLAGGVEREFVTFNLSVLSERLVSSPRVLTVTVPARGASEPAKFVLEETPSAEGSAVTMPVPTRAAILEVGQGSQVVQVVPLAFPEPADVPVLP